MSFQFDLNFFVIVLNRLMYMQVYHRSFNQTTTIYCFQ